MEHLKFVVIVLKKGLRLYGYIFHKDYECQKEEYCRFVEHKNIHIYLNNNDDNSIKELYKKDIKYIDFNLRF